MSLGLIRVKLKQKKMSELFHFLYVFHFPYVKPYKNVWKMYYNIYIYVFKDYYPDIKRYKLNLFLNQSKKKERTWLIFWFCKQILYIM